MTCENCGTENRESARFCVGCGAALSNEKQRIETASSFNGATTKIDIQIPAQAKSNGIGTAGFILALLGLFLSWVPVAGWIIWVLGAILSSVGMFKVPKGLAIAGVIISFIDLIILILTITACSAITASLH
ncbi:MAG: zinc ribbon domain-containing protein [Coriobacteriales bacterium]|jgi:hypothetical protein|nr:zinc ribbon domain-containing protein [Coriobacteriales bacterium]